MRGLLFLLGPHKFLHMLQGESGERSPGEPRMLEESELAPDPLTGIEGVKPLEEGMRQNLKEDGTNHPSLW